MPFSGFSVEQSQLATSPSLRDATLTVSRYATITIQHMKERENIQVSIEVHVGLGYRRRKSVGYHSTLRKVWASTHCLIIYSSDSCSIAVSSSTTSMTSSSFYCMPVQFQLFGICVVVVAYFIPDYAVFNW
jgi:hypothetical protein